MEKNALACKIYQGVEKYEVVTVSKIELSS